MQINIEKRNLVIFGLFIVGLVAIISGILVYSYNTGNPTYVGHTADEIEGLGEYIGGCNWEGIKCHCNADNSGTHRGTLTIAANCTNGILTDIYIKDLVVSDRSKSCPSTAPIGCDIYNYDNGPI